MTKERNIPLREILTQGPERLCGDGQENIGVWYDWFCPDVELPQRGQVLLACLKLLIDSPLIDLDKHYVWFKNNQPAFDDSYDDFRIADCETGETLFTVSPRESRQSGIATVWGAQNNFASPLVKGTWEDVFAFFIPEAAQLRALGYDYRMDMPDGEVTISDPVDRHSYRLTGPVIASTELIREALLSVTGCQDTDRVPKELQDFLRSVDCSVADRLWNWLDSTPEALSDMIMVLVDSHPGLTDNTDN